MKVLAPLTITESMLTASTLAETEHAAWSSGATYALGARVIKAHRVYESAQASNLNHDPVTDTAHTWWLDVGPTNRWAMFDQSVSTASSDAAAIVVAVTPGAVVNAVACVSAVGSTVRVRMLDGVTPVYDQTQTLDSTPIADWDAYFFAAQALAGELLFAGLPRYLSAAVEVTIEPATGTASVGVLAIGTLHAIGSVESGASAGIIDYSRKITDDFGNTTLVPRSYAKRTQQRMTLDTSDLRRVQMLLAGLRAVPCVWIGEPDTVLYAPLVVYGWCKSFSLDIPGPVLAYCTLEVEGLT